MKVPLRSRDGGIQIRTTERGLPIGLELHESQLCKAPTELAREILLLCQLSARRAQVAKRRDLVARGFSAQVVRGLNLSTEDELAQLEAELGGDDLDVLLDTWMRPV